MGSLASYYAYCDKEMSKGYAKRELNESQYTIFTALNKMNINDRKGVLKFFCKYCGKMSVEDCFCQDDD